MADEEEKRRLLEGPQLVVEATAIRGFFKDYRWLSNFHVEPFIMDGVIWPSVEHAYQAAKAGTGHDFDMIANAETPNEARLMGKRTELPDDWEARKLDIMTRCVFIKFVTSNELTKKLVATGDLHLEETNWWRDRFWGVYRGEGRNELGKILMDVRRWLRKVV